MTELEYIEIEGFKGLEHVEFKPTDINLVTGRNNTGKTSLLEAIDLSFAPRNVSNFTNNLRRLVHVDLEKCIVHVMTTNGSSTVHIDTPSEKDAKEYFIELLISSVSLSIGGSHGLVPYNRETAPEYANEIEYSMAQAIERVVKRDERNLFSNYDEMCVRFRLNNELYPFIDIGRIVPEVTLEIYDELKNILESKFDYVEFGEHRDMAVIYLNSKNKPILFDFDRRIWQGTFLEEPPMQGHVKFINSRQLMAAFPKGDIDEHAVRIDDIGDLIKEKGLVDHLKTFTPGYLVFEREDGEKYDIPYEFMGDGFKAIVNLLWELLDGEVKNDIVLLEEPENHMHPGYIREVVYFLIDLAKNENIQLFITTHNSDFINSFFTENLTDEEEQFLQEEFSLVRMEEDTAVVEAYETAKDDLKNLHLDLRGI